MPSIRAVGNSDDPFEAILRPPPGETAEQKAERIRREEEAKRVSQAIDESLKQERIERKKRRVVRLLLLGQSESGKSTTLRQFQRLYTPTAFRQERVLWRSVIQLNLIRSIRTILDALPSGSGGSSYTHSPPRYSRSNSQSDYPRSTNGHGYSRGHTKSDYSRSPSRKRSPKYAHYSSYQMASSASQTRSYGSATLDIFEEDREGSPPPGASSSSPPFNNLSPEFDSDERLLAAMGSPALPEIRDRLEILRDVESSLIRKLLVDPVREGEGVDLDDDEERGRWAHVNGKSKAFEDAAMNGNWPWTNEEVFIRPGTAWKGALAKMVQPIGADNDIPPVPSLSNSVTTRATTTASSSPIDLFAASTMQNARRPSCPGIEESPTSILNQLREDMVALWHDRAVREVLRRRKLRLEEGPGFFLNDIERITSLKYTPTEDDVLKARLKTVGVSEYKFEMEASAGKESGTEWRIVDVGGSRSQRPTWMPFFDDVDAIIFLAPISGFDQVLTEDRSINRLEDSVLLWKAICSNKLLASVELVLFLNKCDILDQKLKSGVRLSKYVRSFGDRPNDLETASKYFRSKFNAIQREYSPNPRKFYGFCTSVTDTNTTAGILASVRDMVIRQHLKQSKLL
ncbi:G-alpha-domain-containing protein [Neolentinus lepideus HHB14362 ss-1]|uniref:G-alpha-domain-containing protein n=1 Tax=Neolentinus lepideus HHB14362 ss-1 TaxID=1314782 RepID=A0A165RQQ4_9AGAM|nr:G-alpha-domain-containing protein [Neolentinus lepideus HHB14362 ss-1]